MWVEPRTLGNTCGCAVNSTIIDGDNEFAAYYERLSDPGVVGERLIPVTVDASISAPTCDMPSLFRQPPFS